MKSVNIVRKLEKEGYKITFKKWSYWDGVPHVELEGFEFAIAECNYLENGWQGINKDFIYQHVLNALNLAKLNNPAILKKMNEGRWDYSIYLIESMQDYYIYKKGKYPFSEYWDIINKLEKEVKQTIAGSMEANNFKRLLASFYLNFII